MKLRISLFIAICFCFLVSNNSYGQNNIPTIKKLQPQITEIKPRAEIKASQKEKITRKNVVKEVYVKKNFPKVINDTGFKQKKTHSSAKRVVRKNNTITASKMNPKPKGLTTSKMSTAKPISRKADLTADIKGLKHKIKTLTEKDSVKYKINIQRLKVVLADKQKQIKELK